MRVLLTCGHRNNGLWLTRRLAEAGHEVVVSDSRPLAFGLRSRYAADFELLPEPPGQEYGDRLLALVRRVRPDVLFPNGRETQVSAMRSVLDRETRVLVAEPDAHACLLDKIRTYELCERLGIPHPTVLGTDPETVSRRLPERGDGNTPIAVLKPRRDVGGGRGLVFVRRREGLEGLWSRLARTFGPLMATDYVRGPVEAQYAVKLLFDGNGELIEFFVLQKLRQWPPGSGITASARSVHEVSLVSRMVPLFRHLRWQGPAEVELKIDADDGSARVLEINPRLSSTLRHDVLAGVDVPGSILKASLGTATPRALEAYYVNGLYYWNPLPWTRSVLSDLRTPAALGRVLRDLPMPLRRRPVGNPYSLRDPGALIGKVGFQISEAIQGRRSRKLKPSRYR